MTLTDRERATLVAALRSWQRSQTANAPQGVVLMDQADVHDAGTPLTAGEVDELCQRMASPPENPLAFDARQPLAVKRFLRSGEFEAGSVRSVHDLYEQAGGMLDRSCCWDLCGECVFESADGRFYAGTIEFVVCEASPEYVREVLEEIACEQEADRRMADSGADASR
jgi:hypothetical protein